MRTRSAKKLAQRIDLYYFRHANPMRRWRTTLSIVLPLAGLLWLGTLTVAGSRTAFSSGPVSASHAFAEAKCEVCHVRDASFRAHVSDQACLTCHDAPGHAVNQEAPPDCATCHREHRGRVALTATADDFCVKCHGELRTRDSGVGTRDSGLGTRGSGLGIRDSGLGVRDSGSGTRAPIARSVTGFPSGHPEFAAVKAGAADPGTLEFNHAVHLGKDLRGAAGPETLDCGGCHKPEVARVSSQRRIATGLMAPLNYEQQCARCHPLFFDERIDAPAPHREPAAVRAFVQQSLREFIAQHPSDVAKVDEPSRRVPLNFPRPVEPPARTAAEWVQRRTARAERLLWGKTCAECHLVTPPASDDQLPKVAASNVRPEWMPRAKFDHAPHLMVECASCHAAAASSRTSDVLMPAAATCATCHAPGKGAESRCFECHGYHDWTKAHAVNPAFRMTDFQH